jgi:hypothetical protein
VTQNCSAVSFFRSTSSLGFLKFTYGAFVGAFATVYVVSASGASGAPP